MSAGCETMSTFECAQGTLQTGMARFQRDRQGPSTSPLAWAALLIPDVESPWSASTPLRIVSPC